MQLPILRLGTVLTYWLVCACLILDARSNPDLFGWLLATIATSPVSLISMFEVETEWDRAWVTLSAVAGAIFNGLFFLWLYSWVVRRLTLRPTFPSDKTT